MTVMSWDEWARQDATALAAEVRAGGSRRGNG
jgi:hypothetical protein